MIKKLCVFLVLNLLLTFSISSQIAVWQQEAETGELLGSSDVAQGCNNASGMAFVRILSNEGNGVRFNNINILKTGTYKLQIAYFNVSVQPLEIIVNSSSSRHSKFSGSSMVLPGSGGKFNILMLSWWKESIPLN
jgi:hypothetical protein